MPQECSKNYTTTSAAPPWVVMNAFHHRLCPPQLHIAAGVARWTHEVHDVVPGGVDLRCREDRAGLPRLLQCPQGVPGIGLVEEPVAVSGECFPVQTAKIVEGQETARIDGDQHVLSIDLGGELGQSIAVGRVIRLRRADVISRPDDFRVAGI